MHIFISAPSTVAPTEIVRMLRRITADRIFAAYPWVKKKYFRVSGLWSRDYYVGTAGNVSSETISKHIEARKSPIRR
nr:transposase [Desulfofarcimen acetoxidans]